MTCPVPEAFGSTLIMGTAPIRAHGIGTALHETQGVVLGVLNWASSRKRRPAVAKHQWCGGEAPRGCV